MTEWTGRERDLAGVGWERCSSLPYFSIATSSAQRARRCAAAVRARSICL